MSESKILQFKRLTSLKDVLLKQIVFNFPKIFLNEDPKDKTFKLKDNVRLPGNLFENVLVISHEIGWPIQMEYLKPCLLQRKKLHLTNINLTMIDLFEKDFIDIAKSEGPITRLELSEVLLTDSMVYALQQLSPHLEFLRIYPLNWKYIDMKSIVLYKWPLRFPKLRELIIRCPFPDCLLLFDLMSCSETLESLEIMGLTLVRKMDLMLKIIESWKSLKVLKHLHVDGGKNQIIGLFIDVVAQLESLRSLKVSMHRVENPSYHLTRLMQGLPNLRHFSVLGYLEENDMEWLRNKKLNYLGFLSDQNPKDYQHASETAQKSGLADSMDNFVTYLVYTNIIVGDCNDSDDKLIRKISTIKTRRLQQHWHKIENWIINSSRPNWFDSRRIYLYLYDVLIPLGKRFIFSPEFSMRLANFVVARSLMRIQQLVEFMLIYIMLNPRNVASLYYLCHLVIAGFQRNHRYNAYRYRSDIPKYLNVIQIECDYMRG